MNKFFRKYRVIELGALCKGQLPRWHIQRRKWLLFWVDDGPRFSCKEHAELEIKLREEE